MWWDLCVKDGSGKGSTQTKIDLKDQEQLHSEGPRDWEDTWHKAQTLHRASRCAQDEGDHSYGTDKDGDVLLESQENQILLRMGLGNDGLCCLLAAGLHVVLHLCPRPALCTGFASQYHGKCALWSLLVTPSACVFC